MCEQNAYIREVKLGAKTQSFQDCRVASVLLVTLFDFISHTDSDSVSKKDIGEVKLGATTQSFQDCRVASVLLVTLFDYVSHTIFPSVSKKRSQGSKTWGQDAVFSRLSSRKCSLSNFV